MKVYNCANKVRVNRNSTDSVLNGNKKCVMIILDIYIYIFFFFYKKLTKRAQKVLINFIKKFGNNAIFCTHCIKTKKDNNIKKKLKIRSAH